MMSTQDFSTLKVLIIDDSPINHRVVSHPLKDKFQEINSAYDGQDGLQQFKELGADIILMDISMPVMNGIDCTKAIRQAEQEAGAQKKSIILAMTGNEDEDKVQTYLDAGMDGYIGKPIDLELLFETISQHSS